MNLSKTLEEIIKNETVKMVSALGTCGGLSFCDEEFYTGDKGTIVAVDGQPLLILDGKPYPKFSSLMKWDIATHIGCPIEVTMYGDDEITIENLLRDEILWSFESYLSELEAEDFEAPEGEPTIVWEKCPWDCLPVGELPEMEEDEVYTVVSTVNGRLVLTDGKEEYRATTGLTLDLGRCYFVHCNKT